jgi:exonuclease III
MTLNLIIITTKKKEQMKVSCNCLRNNFEDLNILTEELMDPTIVCLQERNIKPEQQTKFGGVISKTVHAERAKHGVAILVKESIKGERFELKTKLTAVAKSRTRKETRSRNGLKDDYKGRNKQNLIGFN